VAFCEIDPFCRRVLAKHWPEVPIHDDIRTLNADWLAEMGAWPDVICGGFPCTDISLAGKGAGITGPQSSLWREYARLIGEIRPRYVLVENVAALLGRGLGDVLGDLAALGYDAEWQVISAADVGAPHLRERVWIVAYPDGHRQSEQGIMDVPERATPRGNREANISFPVHPPMANPNGPRLPGAEQPEQRKPIITPADIWRAASECRWGRAEPGMGRTLDGVPAGAHRYPVEVEPWEGDTPRTVGRGYPDRPSRLRALGNAVVPQIPELIGRAIMEANP
jgi:DNA (cytosine-5)-methyltransferase 1